MQIKLPWNLGTITIVGNDGGSNANGSNGNGNGKYVKKEDCDQLHRLFGESLDRKLGELRLDRNQKLLELKSDLLNHIDIKFELMKNARTD